jgi:hypothetical protein
MNRLARIASVLFATTCALPANAVIVFDNGAVNVINGVETDSIAVLDGPGGATTTLIVEAPADLAERVAAHQSSFVRINGGTLQKNLDGHGFANVEIHAGSISYIQAFDAATIEMFGGAVAGNAQVASAGKLFMRGGTIGGEIRPFIFGQVTIYGTSFSVPFGTYDASDSPMFGVTGTLVSGAPFDNDIWIADSATVTFVREPSLPALSAVSMSLLAAAMGLLAVDRIRRAER